MPGILYLLCLTIVLASSLHSAEQDWERLLQVAPEDPAFFHEHSYMPEMNQPEKTASLPNAAEISDEVYKENQKKKVSKDDRLKFNTPSFVQIFFVAVIVIVLIVYRFRVNKTQPNA